VTNGPSYAPPPSDSRGAPPASTNNSFEVCVFIV
jgi:hypothetical protein